MAHRDRLAGLPGRRHPPPPGLSPSRPGKDVNSSPSVIKPLLAADLLDRLYLMILPEIAGNGQRLFDDGLSASKWKLTHQETGELGEIAMVYDRAR
ncbi:dihydrofolate reductase family protein [Streptomyces rochei]|uniref:dihydrofolate reductase family protein n=1 Tax=Streptomyces rochei TaxID=1928 RepID=UPI00294A1D51|nr:dihydrofolate reductase family protein [Streptomyces sp. UP1A-1]